jgi:DNA-directed RNA polymerase specialized sigma subunit
VTEQRDALILKHLPIVDRLVARLVRAGLPRHIDRRDVAQVGYLQVVKTISSPYRPKNISLENRIIAHVRREVVRYLEREHRWSDAVVLVDSYEGIERNEL